MGRWAGPEPLRWGGGGGAQAGGAQARCRPEHLPQPPGAGPHVRVSWLMCELFGNF